jgi:hypothetical protein
MKTKLFFLALIPILFGQTSLSQINDLEPENSILALNSAKFSYGKTLRSFLLSDLPNSTVARVIVYSTVRPEFVISIDKSNDMYLLTSKDLISNIGGTWKENKEINISSFQAISHEIEIGSQITQKINRLFSLAISQVKYPSELRDTKDTLTYVFISNYGPTSRSGALSDASNSERLKGLVEVTEWLHNCAIREKLSDLDSYNKQIDKLLQQFKK